MLTRTHDIWGRYQWLMASESASGKLSAWSSFRFYELSYHWTREVLVLGEDESVLLWLLFEENLPLLLQYIQLSKSYFYVHCLRALMHCLGNEEKDNINKCTCWFAVLGSRSRQICLMPPGFKLIDRRDSAYPLNLQPCFGSISTTMEMGVSISPIQRV